MPLCRANAAGLRNRRISPVSPMILAAVITATPGGGQQFGDQDGDQGGQVLLQLVISADRAVMRASWTARSAARRWRAGPAARPPARRGPGQSPATAAAGQRVFVSSRAAWYSPAARRLTARLLAAVRVSGWSSPRSRWRRARVSSSSCTWALLSSPAIPALSPRRRVRAKLPGCRYPTGCRPAGPGRRRYSGPAATALAPRRSSGIATRPGCLSV